MELFIHWNPSPVAIDLHFLKIQWYGILWGIGLLATYYIAEFALREMSRSDEKLPLAFQYIFIGGILGARIGHILFYQLDFYIANPQKLIAIWEGGLASHGGVIGVLTGVYFFSIRNKDMPFLLMLDLTFLSTFFLASLIRFGNLMNSELVGTPTQMPWGFIFGSETFARHPVVLYESIAYFIFQPMAIFILLKYKDKKPGIYSAFFLIGVFTVRFFLEFLKVPDGFVFIGINKTQWLNVPFIFLGVLLFVLIRKGKLRYNFNQSSVINYQ